VHRVTTQRVNQRLRRATHTVHDRRGSGAIRILPTFPSPDRAMSDIKFSSEEKTLIVAKLQRYFSEELKQQIGRFDAEFLIDFISEEIGGYYYNRGVYDAQTVVAARLEDIGDQLFQLERRTDFKR
jgi:uncharacterized protein (DUF2164 family)